MYSAEVWCLILEHTLIWLLCVIKSCFIFNPYFKIDTYYSHFTKIKMFESAYQ